MLKYSDLIVWQYAVELARQTYLHSSAFPREEMYGLYRIGMNLRLFYKSCLSVLTAFKFKASHFH